MRVFVTGAGGFIGGHLCGVLKTHGHEVMASMPGAEAVVHLANIALVDGRLIQLTWREGTAAPLRSRFARVRIAPIRGAAGRAEETLLIEWPQGEAAPTKYWLSNLDRTISLRRLVDIADRHAMAPCLPALL